jgi:hypothetical protein
MRAIPLALPLTLLAATACRSATAPQVTVPQPIEPGDARDPRFERFAELKRRWKLQCDALDADVDAANIAAAWAEPLVVHRFTRRIDLDRGELNAIYVECQSLAPDVPAALQFCVDASIWWFARDPFDRHGGPETVWKTVREAPHSESVEQCLWKLWNGSDPAGDARYPYLNCLSRMDDLPADSLARGWARLAKAVWVNGVGAPDFALRDQKLMLDALGALESDYPGTNVARHAQALRHIVEALGAGTPAPALSLVDLEGRPMNLAEERGHCALFVFWDPDGDCTERVLKRIHQLSSRIDMRGVQIGGDAADVARLLQGSRQPWRIALAAEQAPALLESWGIHALPATFLIDEQGRVRAMDLYGDALDRAVRELKAGTLASARER